MNPFLFFLLIVGGVIVGIIVAMVLAVLFCALVSWWDRMQVPGGSYPVRRFEGPDGEEVVIRAPDSFRFTAEDAKKINVRSDGWEVGEWVENEDGSVSCKFTLKSSIVKDAPWLP